MLWYFGQRCQVRSTTEVDYCEVDYCHVSFALQVRRIWNNLRI
jgi:hypothetical protein